MGMILTLTVVPVRATQANRLDLVAAFLLLSADENLPVLRSHPVLGIECHSRRQRDSNTSPGTNDWNTAAN